MESKLKSILENLASTGRMPEITRSFFEISIRDARSHPDLHNETEIDEDLAQIFTILLHYNLPVGPEIEVSITSYDTWFNSKMDELKAAGWTGDERLVKKHRKAMKSMYKNYHQLLTLISKQNANK